MKKIEEGIYERFDEKGNLLYKDVTTTIREYDNTGLKLEKATRSEESYDYSVNGKEELRGTKVKTTVYREEE